MKAVGLVGFGALGVFASLAAFGRPVIDGKIGADEWAGVKWHRGMKPFELEKALAKNVKDVEFGFLSDEKNLYLVARCHEPDIEKLKAHSPNIPLWGSESIEIFLSPDGTSFEFYHFVFSPAGNRVYTEFRSEGGSITPVPFNPVWERAAGYEEKAWVFEMAVPLSAFAMTRNSHWTTKWRYNVARTVKYPRYVNTTYAPLFEGYMESEKYVVEDGFPKRAAGDDLALFAATARLEARKGSGFEGTYSVDLTVPTAGTYELNGNRLDLPAGASTVTVPCACEREGRVMTRFTLKNVRDGNVYAHDYPVWVEFRPVRVKLTTPAYRNNFYPGQPTDRVAGTVEVMSGKDAVLTLEGPGFPKRTVTVKGGKGTFEFDTKGFQIGDAKLTAVAEGNEPLTLKIRNLPPTGHNMVWIENGHLVANGRPVYRRNLYGPRYRTGKKLDELITAEWASQAFTPEMEASISMDPQDYIRGIEQTEGVKDVYPSQKILDKLAKVIDANRDRDFGSYYLNDEPECRNVSPIWLRHIYNFIAERDPYHPIRGASRGGQEHVDCFDVIETHPYICPRNNKDGTRAFTRHPRTIPTFIRRFGCEGRPDKVIGHIPMLFAYRYQSFDLDYPTFREYVCAGWVGMIAGSMTFWPYCGHDWYDRASLWHGNRYLFQSVAALETPLLLGRRTLVLDTPDAIAAVWEQTNGDTLLAIVNLGEKPLDAYKALKDVPQLKGLTLYEHRGSRVFALGSDGVAESGRDGVPSPSAAGGGTPALPKTRGPAAASLRLASLETFVASVQRHDVGLETYAKVDARVAAEEKARLSRDNQLLERYVDVTFAGDFLKGHAYKMIDGALWQQAETPVSWKLRPALEVVCSNGLKPKFDRVIIHGAFDKTVGTPWVEVWHKDAWLPLGAKNVLVEKFRREIRLDAPVTSDRFRVVFPGQQGQRNWIELYEIEVPRLPVVEKPGPKAGKPKAGKPKSGKPKSGKTCAADGWRPLFAPDYSDGDFDPAVWHLDADGNLTAEKDIAFWTKDEYSRFELECEYNLEPAGNSGVVIYCSDTEDWIPNSVEIQLLDNAAPKWKGLNPRQANLSFFGHQAPKGNPARPAGEWNRLRLKADGPHLEVSLNGVLVNVCDLSKWTDAKKLPDGSAIPPWLTRPWSELATTGRIGFQGRHAGAGVRFRNIRIRPLPSARRIRRLMSFNIRMGCGHDDPFKLAKGSLGHLPQCARVIGDCRPDFCGLQEVDRFSDRAGGMDQTAELAKLCGMEGSWVEKVPKYGISALYRERPFRVSKVLMKGSLHTRALMVSEFPDCVVANTHYPLSDETCAAAAETTLRALAPYAKAKPVFLMGDFNSKPGSEAIRRIERDFVALSDKSAFTWPAKAPDRTIDYVFVDRAHAGVFKVVTRRVLPVPEATDHAALLVELSDALAPAPAGETLVLTGDRTIREPIVFKSNMTVVLDGAHLTLGTGTFTNMFRADGVTNVTLIGRNGATADGGVYNGLGERTAKKLGMPVWLNNTLLFTNVKGFRVEGIRFTNQRWWALNFIGCSQGVIRNLDFLANHESVLPDGTVTNVVSRSNYAAARIKNADGVDLRVGCHDILIENITGFTEDDTVALTALTGGHEEAFLAPDVPREITDVTIRNVRSSTMCANVRLLAQGGARMHRITVDGVEDASDGKTYLLGRGGSTINLGDSHEYRRQNKPGDMTDIVIRNIRSRADVGVWLRGHAERVTVENAVGYDGCPKPFSDERLKGLK